MVSPNQNLNFFDQFILSSLVSVTTSLSGFPSFAGGIRYANS